MAVQTVQSYRRNVDRQVPYKSPNPTPPPTPGQNCQPHSACRVLSPFAVDSGSDHATPAIERPSEASVRSLPTRHGVLEAGDTLVSRASDAHRPARAFRARIECSVTYIYYPPGSKQGDGTAEDGLSVGRS